MPLELQQLRQAVALAEHGSFVRAAAALHISQPALSRSIQNLERAFGGDLFLRSSTGVVPTDLGRIYIERVRDLLRQADELDREAVLRGSLGAGRVSIGGGPFPADSFLGPAAARFVEQHPKVNVQVIVGGWDELLRSLRNRQLDFFLAETSTLQRDPDLDVAALPSAHPLYMTARAGHPLTRRGKLALLDLFEWPFVAASRVPPRILEPMLAGHRAAARQGRSVLPFPSMLCNSTGPVKRIVECSDALTAAPLFCLAPELESGRVVLLHTEPWLRLQYGIVSMKGRPWTEAAQRLRDAVLDAEREASADERRLALRYAPARSRSTGARRRR